MPRSPSRNRSDRYAGNRGYFNATDWLRRWKACAFLAGVAGVAAWVAVEVLSPRAAAFHTHGELAGPHAPWKDDCAACHRAHGVAEVGPGSVFQVRDRWHDLTCQKCHPGPPHHATVADDGRAFHDRCSNCHHDHGGAANSLTRISDDHCTRCHTDLGNHRDLAKAGTGGGRYEAAGDALAIASFATNHPEFKALRGPARATPRGLHFSHALHMTPGLVYEAVGDAQKGTPADPTWTAARVEAMSGRAAADPYRPLDTGAAGIQLECGSCHQLDAGRSNAGGAGAPGGGDGAYYRPVNFDAHCGACHPVRTPALESNGSLLKEFTLPHGKQPADLRNVLRGEFARRLAAPDNPVLAPLVGPGGRFDPRTPAGAAGFTAEVDRLTKKSMTALVSDTAQAGPKAAHAVGGTGCAKCHVPAESLPAPAGDVRVAPLPDHAVWFPHARFSHAPHRGMTCASCHPGTDTPPAPVGHAANEPEPVAIWGIKSCQACHAPKGTTVDHPAFTAPVPALGVRHGCTDCHKYHDGDGPARDPHAALDLKRFLGGGR